MTPAPNETPILSPLIRRAMYLRVWLGKHLRLNEIHSMLVWAAAMGILCAWSSILFKDATDEIHRLFTGSGEGFVASFIAMPPWRRVVVPVIGGLLAGLTLYLGNRFKKQKSSTDYMEAVVVGDGNIPVRTSLVKCLSALFSGASGASIGREGPLVQLASLTASLTGRILGFPLARKRQLVACGAAAGIAGAYNAPIAGAFFVAEIVLGSVAMEAFGPLVVSSVIATLVTRSHYGAQAIYEAPAFALESNWLLLPYLILGLLTGILAPVFLDVLHRSEKLFGALRIPLWLRLAAGGLIVGGLAVFFPEVTGNGRNMVFGILHHNDTWNVLAVLLICKVAATAATFGSGAVGGVFTPTLSAGAAIGYLFGIAVAALFPTLGIAPGAFGLVGMGAFLAAATGAPVMAIIMIFELTLNYQIIMPVMLASVLGYYVARGLTSRSLYGDALQRKGAHAVARHLAALKIGALATPDPATVPFAADFGVISRAFLHTRYNVLHVVDEKNYLGAISLEDIKPYLDHPELEALVIARDIMREDLPTLTADQSMTEGLLVFADTSSDRLPVLDHNHHLIGAISRNDILLMLAGRSRRTSIP